MVGLYHVWLITSMYQPGVWKIKGYRTASSSTRALADQRRPSIFLLHRSARIVSFKSDSEPL